MLSLLSSTTLFAFFLCNCTLKTERGEPQLASVMLALLAGLALVIAHRWSCVRAKQQLINCNLAIWVCLVSMISRGFVHVVLGSVHCRCK